MVGESPTRLVIAMMTVAPAAMVAAVPAVMMTAAAMMPAPVTMTMAVAMLYLDHAVVLDRKGRYPKPCGGG